jgi:D-glycero-D-manno-heptose 1,7-bisphosphate phosphatase
VPRPPRPAAFLDRDGTLIRDEHYLADPGLVVPIAGASAAVARLNDAGVPVIVVTNQSGIARGLVTEAQYEAVRARVDAVLAAEGARVDAHYHCPHHPDFGSACECRKPGPLLYQRAAAEHGLSLAGSLYAGDRWRDVAPALAFGGTGVLIPSHNTPAADEERARREARVARTLGEVVDAFLAAHSRATY